METGKRKPWRRQGAWSCSIGGIFFFLFNNNKRGKIKENVWFSHSIFGPIVAIFSLSPLDRWQRDTQTSLWTQAWVGRPWRTWQAAFSLAWEIDIAIRFYPSQCKQTIRSANDLAGQGTTSTSHPSDLPSSAKTIACRWQNDDELCAVHLVGIETLFSGSPALSVMEVITKCGALKVATVTPNLKNSDCLLTRSIIRRSRINSTHAWLRPC